MLGLKLKGLNYKFKKVNKEKMEIYYNEETKNSIIFDPIDDECNAFSIRKGIADDAYKYLISRLNETKNTLVYWSQIARTTSDYTIYYDMDFKKLPVSMLTIKEILDQAVKGERVFAYKYKEVKDGNESKITFNRDKVERDEKFDKNKFIDHVNCQTLDNRIENLRLV